jgi:hypothetical protein
MKARIPSNSLFVANQIKIGRLTMRRPVDVKAQLWVCFLPTMIFFPFSQAASVVIVLSALLAAFSHKQQIN